MPAQHVDLAEKALRHFGDDLTRQSAARLLSMWSGRFMLDPADEVALLDRFDPEDWPAAIHRRKAVSA